ncbi:DUF4230 domain-containing protein [Pleomorphovibrio marinus]|uniref:DUF4230 domain-containing protein n=1 Tax=Pleomorphovibrio marinus TaxID=2164132 RepID=UPI000E0A387E|nr:DUF4230 domain-containing protein [Pleomorphovibrio marinus]
MYRFLAGVVLTLILVVSIFFFFQRKEESEELRLNSAMIQQQINQVGKLIVTEGNFSQIVSYRNTRRNYFDIFAANKKALVVVNAKVTVGYDLREIQTEIDEANRTVRLTYIPPPEINIYPDIEYYDVSQDYFNKFGAEDYNKIKGRVTTMMEEKIKQSNLEENAKERLLSELAKIYILTQSMGWTLTYEESIIDSMEDFNRLQF